MTATVIELDQEGPTPRSCGSSGDITSASEADLMAAYGLAVANGATAVVLDFSRLDYMNSGGIGLLVTLLVRAQRSGGRLVATGLSDHYRQIFELTRLDEAIEIIDDEAAAVRRRRLTDRGGRHGRTDDRSRLRSQRRRPNPPQSHAANRDAANWAQPVDRLSAAGVAGAKDDAVTGKRVSGPAAGLRPAVAEDIHASGSTASETSRRRRSSPPGRNAFPTFWPKGQRFYAPLSGIAPGEVALLEIQPVPGAPVRLSTGVLVLYADDESFTFMTPEGHTLSAWITFSARRDGDVTIAQAQALERPSDPFDELAYKLGGNRQNNRFWQATLRNLATAVGVDGAGGRDVQSSASTATASGATGATSATAPRSDRRAGR